VSLPQLIVALLVHEDASIFHQCPGWPVLVRIVRMTFAPKSSEQFLAQFDEAAPHIRSFSGCHHLELWRDVEAPTTCTTYSQWESPQALAEYKNSELFKRTWSTVKPLFDARPRAQSYRVARPADAIDDAAQRVSDSTAP